MRLFIAAALAALCAIAASMPTASAYPGHCEIEIINTMAHDAVVHGTFDDGSHLAPFRVAPHAAPHYVTLFYGGYCHQHITLRIQTLGTPHEAMVYQAWTKVGATVRLVSP